MACVRKRRGKWVVDYRDSSAIRRSVTCRTKREAMDLLGDRLRESRQSTRPVVNPNITVVAYAERWFGLIAATVKPRTLESYRSTFRRYLLGAFGGVKVRQLQKGRVKTF